MQIGISNLDNKTLVVYVEPGDDGPVVEMLKTRGHGYAVFGENVLEPFVVIDKRLLEKQEYTDDHILAIEAHELGHIHELSDDEEIAEHAGIELLSRLGKDAAADLLRSRGII